MRQVIPMEKGLSVVIPVYKSEKILPFLIESLKKSLDAFDKIITVDDDLQHPPEEIHKLLAELEKGYDVVYGFPAKETHLPWRNFSSRLMKQMLKLSLGVVGIEKSGAFRAFRTVLRDGFADYNSSFVSIDVLLTWSTTRLGYIPVLHAPRAEGESNYTFKKLVRHTANLVTGFSALPLQLASWLGFALTLFGIGVFVYVLGRYFLQGSPVPGFPFLASIIAIFSGAQLFAMGIFGEYLSRMYFRLMGKPQSLVRDEVGFQQKKEE